MLPPLSRFGGEATATSAALSTRGCAEAPRSVQDPVRERAPASRIVCARDGRSAACAREKFEWRDRGRFWIRWLDASATEVDDWRADRSESGGVRVATLGANDRDRLAGECTKADRTAEAVAAKTDCASPCGQLVEEGLEGEDGRTCESHPCRPGIDEARPPTARVCKPQAEWEEMPARRPLDAGDRKDAGASPDGLYDRLDGTLGRRRRPAKRQCVHAHFAACQVHA